MKKYIPTFEEYTNEDNREDFKLLKDRLNNKKKIKKNLIDKMKKQRKKGENAKSEITKAQIDIKDQEIEVIQSKGSVIKQKESMKK